MAVQYNSKDNSWGGIVVDLLKTKKGIVEVSDEATKFFDKTKNWKPSSLVITDEKKFDSFIKKMNLADESLISFLQDTKYPEKTLANYQLYLKNSANSMTLFQRATKAASTAGNILVSTLANMVISWVVSELISGFVQLITYSDYLADKAEKLGSAFNSSKSDIEDYKEKITELYDKINDSSTSYDDVIQARKDLMTIQDELIDKFGNEENAIKNITDAIKGQTSALDELTSTQYTKMINNFNKTNGWGWLQNLLAGGKSNYQQMIDNMENSTIYINLSKNKKLNEYIKQLGGVEQFDEYGVNKNIFELSGNLDDIYNKLIRIQETANNFGEEKYSQGLSNQANKLDNLINKYQDIYNSYILYEKVLSDDNDYADYFKSAIDKYETYKNVAENKGINSLEAKEKAEDYAKTITEAMEIALKNGDTGVYNYFNDLYPDLQDLVGKWNFKIHFQAALDNDEDDFENQVKNALSQFKTIEDLMGYNSKTATEEQTNAINYLNDIKSQYNMSDDEFYDTLLEMNLIDSQSKIDLTKQVVKNYIDQSKQQRQSAIEKAKQALDNEYNKITSEEFSLGEYEDAIKKNIISAKFGNVDMDKRTIIHWSDELKQTYADELASWDYDPEVGSVDTVFGGSERFGEELNGKGWEVAFTPILPDGTLLSKETVEKYINSILKEAYSNDGIVTEDELKLLDSQGMLIEKVDEEGRFVGFQFVKGIFAGIDDSSNYENNGNKADVIGRLMHFVGKFGAINLEKNNVAQTIKQNVLSLFNKLNISDEIKSWIDDLSQSDAELANSTEFKTAIEERKKALNGAQLSVQDYINALNSIKNPEENLSKNVSKSQMIDTINDMSDGFDVLGKIYKDVLNGGEFDFTNLSTKKFSEAFSGLETEYTDFIEKVSASPNDISACQEAFNDLVTSWINSKGILNDVSEETASVTIAMLKNMHVTNAEEIVTSKLIDKQAELEAQSYYTENATNRLSNATISEYNEFVTEAELSEKTKEKLAQLAIQKIAINNVKINTSDDIDQVIALANAAGASAIQLAKLAEAKAIIEKYNADGLNGTTADLRKYEEAQELIKSIENGTFKIDNMLDASTFKFNNPLSSDEAKETIDDAYQKELKLLEFYHETLQMNDEDYYANKLELAKKYYGNSEAYAEEYRDKIKEIFTELNSYLLNKAQKVVDAVSEYYQYQIDNINRENDKLNNQKDIYDKVISGIVNAYEDKIDAIQRTIDVLEEENELMDNALSGIDDMYNDEIDRLNEQKQSIQDIIDAMQDENDERDRAIQLQKAQAALDKANSQKTKKIIDVNGQAKYVADDEAIKEAQDTLDSQIFENTISELEKQQEALDDTISKLEEYQQKWADISDLFEKNKNANAAKAFFGDDYVNKLLYADPETLKEFKDFQIKYVSNQNQIDTNNKIMEQYTKLKDEWSDLSDAYEKSQNKIIAMNQFGLETEGELLNLRISNSQKFVTEHQAMQAKIYNNELAIKSLEEKKQAWEDATTAYKQDLNEIIVRQAGFIDEQGELLEQSDENMTRFIEAYNLLQLQFADEAQMFGNSARSIVGNAQDICNATKDAMDAIRQYQLLTGSIPSYARNGITNSIPGLATGGKVIKSGTILTGEEGYEGYISDGKFSIVGKDGMELINAKSGDQVLNHEDTNELLKGLKPYVPAFASGNISLDELGRSLVNNVPYYTPSLPKISNFSNMTNMGNNITVEMNGGIHLHGVQDVDGLAKAIDTNLINAINHRINQRK